MEPSPENPPPTPPDFEQALAQLEQLVQRMEDGEQSLDAALTDFEHGITLVRTCRDGLERAEQRVQILLGNNADETRLEDLAATPDDEADDA